MATLTYYVDLCEDCERLLRDQLPEDRDSGFYANCYVCGVEGQTHSYSSPVPWEFKHVAPGSTSNTGSESGAMSADVTVVTVESEQPC